MVAHVVVPNLIGIGMFKRCFSFLLLQSYGQASHQDGDQLPDPPPARHPAPYLPYQPLHLVSNVE